MGKNFDTTDNTNKSTEKSLTSSQSLQNEVQEVRKNGNVTVDKSKSTTNDVLPSLSFTDSTDEKKDGMREEILSNGNKLVHIESNGRSSEVEYNSQNQAIRYKDFSGEEFTNTNPGATDGGVWLSKTNRVQNKETGYKIKFDTTSGVTTVEDLSTNIKTETDSAGKETTIFPDSAAKLVKTSNADGETFEMLDATGTKRSMHVKDNKLQDYTDENGITYTRSEQFKDKDVDGNIVRTYVFTAKKGDEAIPGEFNVSADSSGTVMVRDLTKCEQNADDACKRVYLNGNVATSDKDGRTRTLKTADGTTITTTTDLDTKMPLTKTVVKPDGSVVSAKYGQGVINSMTTTSPDGQTSNYQRVALTTDTLVSGSSSNSPALWFKDRMTPVDDPTKMIDTTDLEKTPKPMQKTPPQVDLKAEIEEAEKHKIDYYHPIDTYNNAMWYYRSVNYGGIYDYKSPATRMTDENGKTIIVKDQLAHPEYEDFGNWNAAMIGNAVGFSLTDIEREAGAVQIEHGTSQSDWGTPGLKIMKGWHVGGTGTYGDDPKDTEMVRRGYSDYEALKNESVSPA